MAVSLKVIERGGHLGHHHLPGGVRGRPARGRADLGPLRPPLAGADRLCGFLRRQHLVRPRHRSAEPVDRPRDPGGRRLRHLGAVPRDRPRPVLGRGAGARDGADHDRDGGGARLLAAARRRARSLFWLAFRIRARRSLRRARRPRLWHRVRRDPSCDADSARSARHRQKLFWPDRRPPLRRAGRNREPDHGRAVLDLLGRAAHIDRGDAFHADSTGPVLRRHRADRVRRRHARDKTGAALRARPLDPGRIVRGRHRQHRDAAGLAVQPLLPAVPRAR